MLRTWKIAVASVFALLIVGAGLVIASHWRPGIPEIVVDLRTGDAQPHTPSLMFIYSETGADPFGPMSGRSVLRFMTCSTRGSLCVSRSSRDEYLPGPARTQSLQIRMFNFDGNPIVGGVRWKGPWHPERIRVVCDLRVADVRRSCAMSNGG